MSKCTITLKDSKEEYTVQCEPGATILEAIGPVHFAHIDSPCGGKGICGKCLVLVEKNRDGGAFPGGVLEVTATEKKKLSDSELEQGYRLACIAEVYGDITVTLPKKADKAVILEKSITFTETPSPRVQKKYGKLEEPSLEDQRDDLTRIREGLDLPVHSFSLATLSCLPGVLREQAYAVTAVYNDESILTVEAGDTTDRQYGLAADIGTTTVVVYLIDVSTGKKIGTASGLNVQKAYGHDVISRINHTMTDEKGLSVLQKGIIGQLGDLINTLTVTYSIAKRHIYSMTIAGNTTMIHLAAGIPPAHIAAAPFIPGVLEQMQVRPGDLGLDLPDYTAVYLLPGISAYIGADITAATLASGMAKKEPMSLLIDIGTNGEIMLGNKERLLSCSTAAGPAFEGATIHDGIGGIAGAIDSVGLSGMELSITTIAEEKPIGICGSGIVDAVSNLLYAGIIDETGRMLPADELSEQAGKALAGRLTEFNGQLAFTLAEVEKTSGTGSIILTQKDIREVQNAKASIAAGIKTLIKKADISMDDVETVFLAGGFGSYIDKHHAVHIGLIPGELEHKIEVIGNAAGSGAIMSLLSAEHFRECTTIAERTTYVELSSSPEFMDEYVNSMMF